MEEKQKRHRLKNKSSTRNLIQYKDMTDEEFDQLWDSRVEEQFPSDELEKRIQSKWDQFAEDYDLDDLKVNDKETLRALIQSIIALEDYEQKMYKLRSEGLDGSNIVLLDKIGKEMTNLRSDMSRFQDDLKITRKTRKSEQETSVLSYIEGLKQKAKEFYRI